MFQKLKKKIDGLDPIAYQDLKLLTASELAYITDVCKTPKEVIEYVQLIKNNGSISMNNNKFNKEINTDQIEKKGGAEPRKHMWLRG